MKKNKKILVILGHPAKKRISLCECLMQNYCQGTKRVGHHIDFIKIADLNFDPILHEGYQGDQTLEPDIIMAQEKIIWADHIVLVYPLWQLMLPALMKGFMERVFTKGFAYDFEGNIPVKKDIFKNKTIRIIQTMAMPAFIYRWIEGRHCIKTLKAMMKFIGFKSCKVTYFGLCENLSDKNYKKYSDEVYKLGFLGK